MDYSGFNIAVIGDFMLDKWVESSDIILSQEAPVVIIKNPVTTQTLGGAGNIVENILSLGAKCYAYGRVGKDDAGEYIMNRLDDIKGCQNQLVRNGRVRTTRKTRIVGQGQQIVRVDEDDYFLSGGDYSLLFNSIQFDDIDAVVIADYNKGVMSKVMIEAVLDRAVERNIPVMVDPKFDNFWEYKGATIFKPNDKESKILGHGSPAERAWQIAEKLDAEWCVITLGYHGMIVGSKTDGSGHTDFPPRIPAHQVDISDVTGAGDTVMAVLTLEYLRTKDIMQAAKLANVAGALAVQQHGTAQITAEELEEAAEKWL